jgi:hypothetical protein
MKGIFILALGAIGLFFLIEGPSLGKLQVASCGRHSAAHSAARCHIVHHNNHYGIALRGNIYGQAGSERAVGSGLIYPVGSSPFYYGSDPDPRIVFELHRDPGWGRGS